MVFVYPGIGQLMVDAVRSRDMPVVQACALIFAATYILLNLSADIISIITNPRLLHPQMTTVEDRELSTENALPKARRTKVSRSGGPCRARRSAPGSA